MVSCFFALIFEKLSVWLCRSQSIFYIRSSKKNHFITVELDDDLIDLSNLNGETSVIRQGK